MEKDLSFKEKHARLQKPIKTPKLKIKKEKAITVSKTKKNSTMGQKSTKKPRIKKPPKITITQLDKICEHLWRIYIRHRDKWKPCISCWKVNDGTFDCGHYMSRRVKSIKWNPTNCNLQCVYCNRYSSSDTHIKYRQSMLNIYPVEHIEWLESQVFKVHKVTEDDLSYWIDFYIGVLTELWYGELAPIGMKKVYNQYLIR